MDHIAYCSNPIERKHKKIREREDLYHIRADVTIEIRD
jgi:hypothetical protein